MNENRPTRGEKERKESKAHRIALLEVKQYDLRLLSFLHDLLGGLYINEREGKGVRARLARLSTSTSVRSLDRGGERESLKNSRQREKQTS